MRNGFLPPSRRDIRAREQRVELRRHARRLLELGVVALHSAFVRHVGTLPHISNLHAYNIDSGHHPFDYGNGGTIYDDDNDDELIDRAPWEEDWSPSYIQNDRKVRHRIIDDQVDFDMEIWASLADGTTLIDLNTYS